MKKTFLDMVYIKYYESALKIKEKQNTHTETYTQMHINMHTYFTWTHFTNIHKHKGTTKHTHISHRYYGN